MKQPVAARARGLTAAGYSGTPLAQKLTLKDGMAVWAPGLPPAIRKEIESGGFALRWLRGARPGLDAAHVFVTRAADLAAHLKALRTRLDPAGMVWVSWPKKASGVTTDITEDRIRDLALPLGFVDIKVCAVDATWSGLKLVVRRALR